MWGPRSARKAVCLGSSTRALGHGVEDDEDHEENHRWRRAFATPITLGLKHSGENGIKAENHRQSYISEMQVQDGLEWRVISGRIQLQAVRQRSPAHWCAGKHLAEAVSNGQPPSPIADITAVTRRYELGVDEEMGMLEQGRVLEALRLPHSQPDHS